MTDVPILAAPERHWVCPKCDETSVTREPLPHTRMHACRGLGGLTAPMVAEGLSAKLELFRPEDYVRDEDVQVDSEGKPIMSVVLTRDEGTDVAVFAPCAHFESE